MEREPCATKRGKAARRARSLGEGGYGGDDFSCSAVRGWGISRKVVDRDAKAGHGRSRPSRWAARALAWARGITKALAVAYPVALTAVTAALSWIGEGWWVTAAALYAPRLAFAAPWPVLLLLLFSLGLRRYLWTQLAAALILLFPLMGFVLPSPSGPGEQPPRIRLLSFNVNSGYSGHQRVVDRIFEFSPDIVVLQEAPFPEPFVELLLGRYPHVRSSTQFVIASRFPILAAAEPARLPFFGGERSARFVHYRIQTPLGNVALFNVHPISPRGVLNINSGRGALHMLRTGQFLQGDPEGDVIYNAGLRALQIQTVADLAKRAQEPVIIAGDTNLPGLSRTLRKLSDFQDGFEEASWGLGYTYPAKRRWLRLDRILASEALQFTSFSTGCEGVSDHLCVVADLQRR